MSQVVGEDLITGLGFIGLEPGRIYRMRRGPKVTTVTVMGNPAVLEHSVRGRFKGLTVHGKSTQVTTTGAQLFDKDALINGIIDPSSGVIYSNNAWVVSDFILANELTNYCISQESEVFFQCRIGYYDASKNKITVDEKTDNVTFFTFSTPEATKYIRIGYSTQLSGNHVDRGNIMLNAGDTALPWEPYTGRKPSPSPDYPQVIQSAGDDGNLSVIVKNPDNEQMQSVSFSTPNGLPGIPVDSDGNYTDQTGQQWICDEVDLERGVYVQRVKKQALKAADFETVSEHDDDTHWYVRQYIEDSSLNGDGLLAYKKVMCSKAIVVSQSEEKIHPYPIVAPYGHDTAAELRFRAPKSLYASAAEYAADLDGCVVAYPLAMPIETPLAGSEIAAYKGLRAYTGTTVVEASDGAGLSVSYGCDLKAAEKEVNGTYASLIAEMEELNENSKTL